MNVSVYPYVLRNASVFARDYVHKPLVISLETNVTSKHHHVCEFMSLHALYYVGVRALLRPLLLLVFQTFSANEQKQVRATKNTKMCACGSPYH